MEWYVLRIQPLQEERVSRELNRHQDIETFLPLAKLEVRLRSGLLVERIRPLFRSYLFISLNWHTAPKASILSTRFVKGFLGYSDLDLDNPDRAPNIVRPKDMTELRRCLSEHGGVLPLNVSRPKEIEPGDMIRVLFGPFRDHVASVQAINGSRVRILLRFLSQDAVTLPKDCLAAAA